MAYQKKVTVFVWDEPLVVSVYQEHKTVWIVVGDYKGESISVQDRSKAQLSNVGTKRRHLGGN
jgi:hypothetical protein